VPLGSGTLQFLLFQDMGTLTARWSALPSSWGEAMPPPIISNFFQHPQGLGMPLALCALLLWTHEVPEAGAARRLRLALAAALLGTLALAQIVFFSVLGLALGAASLARARRRRDPRGLALELGLLLGALALARSLGGFFAPGPSPAEIFVFEPFMPGSAGLRVTWHATMFGLPLLTLPFALHRLREDPSPLRVALAVAVAVGFAVPNMVRYRLSWDIVKFYGIGGFFLNLLFADLVARAAARGGARRAFAALGAALAAWSGLFFIVRMSALDGRLGVPPMHFPPPSAIGRLAAEALEPHAGPDDLVFSTNVDVGLAGGLLTPGFDRRQLGHSFMLDEARMDAWYAAKERARRDLGAEDLARLGVRFLVLSPGDEAALSSAGRAALDDPSRFERLGEVEHGGDRRALFRVR
jgi:hypothetical protein